MEKIKIGLVGVGTFAERDLIPTIKQVELDGRIELVSYCDSNIKASSQILSKAQYGNIRSYANYDMFLAHETSLDAVVIATPIHLHPEMAIQAMEAGYDVYLEKPAAVVIQDVDRMIETQMRTNKTCAIGFQWTSARSFQTFVDELETGVIGNINEVIGVGLWKRTSAYFNRSPWVGKLLFQNEYVLDGTINNPFSHLLMNMLIVSNIGTDKLVAPVSVQAELYRANDIESEDTSCIRLVLDNDVTVLFYASICASEDETPYIRVEGTDGSGYWYYDGTICFTDKQGRIIKEMEVVTNVRHDHLINFVNYLEGRTSRLSSPVANTRIFTLVSNLAFESAKAVKAISKNHYTIKKFENNEDYIYINQISEIMTACIHNKKLYSEMNVTWARRTEPVQAAGYKRFNLFKQQVR